MDCKNFLALPQFSKPKHIGLIQLVISTDSWQGFCIVSINSVIVG
jgi:hypothetical protein